MAICATRWHVIWKAADVKEVKYRYEALSSAFTKVIAAIKARVESVEN